MPLSAVLFDHDGTLVDSEPVHFRHWLEALADQPVTLTEAIYRESFAGIPNAGNAQWIAERHPITVSAATLVERKEAITRAMLEAGAFPLVDGALAVISEFERRGVRMAVVTGAGPHAVAATVRVHGLAGHLPVIVSSADVARSKPAPDVYLLALERLGLPAADCLAFEDSQGGLQAALAAGLRCCAIRTPYTAHHDFTGATVVVDSLADGARWALANG